jgi:hypothetical protein
MDVGKIFLFRSKVGKVGYSSTFSVNFFFRHRMTVKSVGKVGLVKEFYFAYRIKFVGKKKNNLFCPLVRLCR